MILILTPHAELTAEMLIKEGEFGSYLTSGLFAIFAMLLAAGVSSDKIAQDLRNRSFILYFSRPISFVSYISAKIMGAFTVMAFFCIVPPLVIGSLIMATQTGPYYSGGFEVLFRTLLAGSVASFIFLPFGIFLSSITKSKAYAGIGSFMSFFVMTLIGELFSDLSYHWKLVNPVNILAYIFDWIYGFGLPEYVSHIYMIMVLIIMVFLPLFGATVNIKIKGVSM